MIFLLLTLPLGLRTVRCSMLVRADRERLWQALWPLGAAAGWSGEIVSANGFRGGAGITLARAGRDGRPVRRKLAFDGVVPGERFSMRIVDDTALGPSFWGHYRETVELSREGDAVRVTVQRTDRYCGFAFLAFRHVAAWRELSRLKAWAEVGRHRRAAWFEHPLMQFGFAVLAALVFWPLFGLDAAGLALAATLVLVVALHELGHMAAFRLTGRREMRVLLVPPHGGTAIGARGGDNRFETAFVALMGTGFSALLVPVSIAASMLAGTAGQPLAADLLAVFAGCAALFNLANLMPVGTFDGGQVLRQICPGPLALNLASFALFSVFLAAGWRAGCSTGFLLAAGAVFLGLSLLTPRAGARPLHALKPLRAFDRFAIGAGLLSVLVIHGCALLWASDTLL